MASGVRIAPSQPMHVPVSPEDPVEGHTAARLRLGSTADAAHRLVPGERQAAAPRSDKRCGRAAARDRAKRPWSAKKSGLGAGPGHPEPRRKGEIALGLSPTIMPLDP